MTPVSSSNESERRVAEALRAHAGAGRGGSAFPAPHGAAHSAPAEGVPGGAATRTALLIALLGGAVLGVALALVSLLAPGALPPLG
jgi:hypothetical protein